MPNEEICKDDNPFGQTRGDVRILVAEDNITNQQVMMAILEKLGLRANVATNGIEVIQALETSSYDLVLMDVHMPEMDGLKATKKIRDPQSRVLDHHVVIIAMTALALQGDREKCLSAGMDDYVTKPVKLETLAAVLEKWLKPRAEAVQKTEEGGAGAFTPTEESPLIFDRATMLHNLMNDVNLAREVFEMFLRDMPSQIRDLKGYVATGDSSLVMQQAHKIRGAAATIGGGAMSALAAVMEQAGEDEDLAIVSAKMPELDAQFEALREAVNHEL